MKEKLVIIGAGPGGYVAAIKAAQLGLNPLVIEKDEFGGTCLNRGCIPTKALIAPAEIFNEIKKASAFGIYATPEFKWNEIVEHAKKSALKNRTGVEYLFKKNKIRSIKGTGKIIDKNTVEVNGEKITTENILIATGSSVKDLPHIKIDKKQVVGSDEALFLEKLPKSMVILGGGVIGVEFAYILNSFGVETTIIEALPTIIPFEDKDIQRELKKHLKKSGIKIITKVFAEKIEKSDDGVELFLNNGKSVKAEMLLSAVGRKPNTENIGLENIGLKIDEKGFIPVDDFYETSIKGVFAVGDIIATPMLAHTAEHEGIVAVERIAEQNPHKIDYNTNPACIYCEPSIASIGMNEQTAVEKGFEIKIGKFPFTANGKAVTSGHTEGFVKVVVDKNNNKILGASIIGHGATDLISEFIPALNQNLKAEDLADAIHPHPTLSEASMEALLNSLKRAIHI